MTDSQKPKKPLTLSSDKLGLKPGAGDRVRQSMGQGRSKTVKVEVKKKRVFNPKGKQGAASQSSSDSSPAFSNQEIQERMKTLQGSLQKQPTTRFERVQDEKPEPKAEEKVEAPEVKEEAPAVVDVPVPPQEPPLVPKNDKEKKAPPKPTKSAVYSSYSDDAADEKASKYAGQLKLATPSKKAGGDDRRRSGRLTVTQALSGEDGERMRSAAAMRRRAQKKMAASMGGGDSQVQKIIREVTLPETITVQELANRLAERGADVVKSLFKLGVMATINQTIDADTAELVIEDMGHKCKRVSDADVEEGLVVADSDASKMLPRAPVVTVMGHVDHGKTSLLDALRKTDVVSGEAGGITQHIGAYQVQLASGDKITFVDTPGHAAFTEMRARGANVTDVVVLVVAADDGVMEQTIEAIHHAKAAGVPVIIAINKIDKPDADPNKVRNMLMQHEIFLESVGGDIMDVEVSAKKGINLDKLEEVILLQAEMLELKADPNRVAQGTVVESRLEKGRGSVATVLVQKGTLKVGDIFVAGREYGRVRALINDRGENVDEAGPSTPIEVLGFNGTPEAGDDFVVTDSEARAREIAEYRIQKYKNAKAAISAQGKGDIFAHIAAGDVKELPIVVKSDVQGSVEAINSSLTKLSTDEVKVNVLHSGVGGITESDVTLANASNAIVIGFNVRANAQAREMARRDNVEIRYYSIIYDVIDDVKAALGGLLSPTMKENFIGNAEIREVFNITKVGKIAGCMVVDGVVKRGAGVRLLRDNVVIHEGKLKTLKRFKDEVKEVKEGYECGMAFENYNDIKAGYIIECFEIEEVARTLD